MVRKKVIYEKTRNWACPVCSGQHFLKPMDVARHIKQKEDPKHERWLERNFGSKKASLLQIEKRIMKQKEKLKIF